MKKVIIFGNSGSGKSTLAKTLCKAEQLTHLDLDTLAWLPNMPPERKSLETSKKDILAFIAANEEWVIEGCYSDLIEVVLPFSSEIIFLNLPVEACIANAHKRPWEPHKYESKEAQDANLEMLITWIAQYTERDDEFSLASHLAIFNAYEGKKSVLVSNA